MGDGNIKILEILFKYSFFAVLFNHSFAREHRNKKLFHIMFSKTHLANRFLFFTASFFILLVVAITFSASFLLKDELTALTQSFIARFVQAHAERELSPEDFTMTAPNAETTFQDFFNGIRLPGVARIKVWDNSARVVFSDEQGLIGQQFLDNQELGEALRGVVAAEITRPIKPENAEEQNYAELMEAYIPIFFANSKDPVGVIEVYFGLDELNVFAARARIFIGLVAVFMAAVFWSTLFLLFRKTVQEPLLEMEKFKLAVDNASDHIIFTNPNGIVVYANQAAERITGYSMKEIIGARPSLWGKQMPVEHYREMWKIIKEEKKPYKSKLQNKRKNGKLYDVELSIWPVLNEKGDIVFFVGLERDITREKEIEKLQTDFLSLASHQLRTPLSGTKWLIETFRRGVLGKVNQKQKAYLEQIYQINEQMIKLVLDILNVLLLESGVVPIQKQTISARALCDALWPMVALAAQEKGITIRNEIKEHAALFMETDVHMTQSILESLISNAINYSQKGQEVVVDAKDEPDAVVFLVKDNGIGIPTEEQGKIFERFYRASNAKVAKPDGTGLGLYIASMLAEKIGAKLSFKSKEGQGSTLYFRIPKKVEKS